MIISWVPVECMDIVGSILALYLAIASLTQARFLLKRTPDNIFRHYILLLTTSIACFAISRSAGHLLKQLLLLSNHKYMWQHVSPFSGAINTTTFIIIFAISLYYQHVTKVHRQIERYSNDLEDLVAQRTVAIEEINTTLADEIIERQQIQQNLIEEKERLAVTLRSIGDGVITTDTKGNIILINKVTERLTGWNQQEAIGQPISQVFNIINEHDHTPRTSPVFKVLESGEIVDLANHTALIAKDGTERSIADSGAPIRDQNNKVIGVVLVFRDITEKKKMRAELMKAEKLESVGVLAGGIAHDFNNILMVILGNLNLVERLIDPEDKIYNLIKSAEKASIRAKDLTQQLLTFSRGGDPIKQTSNISEIIRDSAEFILHGSQTICQYSIPNDLWLVNIDKGQISQVIQNIIINARQAMPEGGKINIECQNIAHPEIESYPPLANNKRYIRITISDNGPGIPQKSIHKIFDPYFTTKEMGSGLGLAITNTIIANHEGFIRADSNHNGTTFFIYLPFNQDNKTTNTPLTKTILNEGHGTILVMDDEDMVRDIAQTMLQLSGYQVISAKNGSKAIDLYKKAEEDNTPIAAVIMDLTIPNGMGGQKAVQEILRINPNAKVLVSSGYSNDPVMVNYQDYGFKGAVIKPYELRELQKAIATVITS